MYICVFVYGSLGNGWMDSDKSCGWFIRLFVVSSVLMMRFELGFPFDYFFLQNKLIHVSLCIHSNKAIMII